MWILPTHCSGRTTDPARQQQNRSYGAVILTAGCIFLSGTAFAQTTASKTTEQNQDQPLIQHSPCTGEDVTGTEHRMFSQQQSPNKMTVRTHENGKGTTATGAEYQFDSMFEQQFVTTAKTFQDQFETRQHLIRTKVGSSPPPTGATNKNDDFFFRQFIKTVFNNGVLNSSVDKETPEDKQCR